MPEPDWDNAPEWADFWAMDGNGEAWWFEEKPTFSASNSRWSGGGRAEEDSNTTFDARRFLRTRPGR